MEGAPERSIGGTVAGIEASAPEQVHPSRRAPIAVRHRADVPEGGRGRDYELVISPEAQDHDIVAEGFDPFPGIARFLLDHAGAWLSPPDLARLFGAAFFAFAPSARRAAVCLKAGAIQAHAWLARPSFGVEHNHFGRVDILYEDETLGLYVLAVAPGARIPPHFHRVMAESELVLDAGLLQQGRPVARGAAFRWPKGFIHEYRNPTRAERRILCLDRPPFIPDDEVEVSGPVELRPLAPAGHYFV